MDDVDISCVFVDLPSNILHCSLTLKQTNFQRAPHSTLVNRAVDMRINGTSREYVAERLGSEIRTKLFKWLVK